MDRWEACVTVRGATLALFETCVFMNYSSLSCIVAFVASFRVLLFYYNCTLLRETLMSLYTGHGLGKISPYEQI